MNLKRFASQKKIAIFSENNTLTNAVGIFVITTLFYFFGAALRLVDELSLFWPLNAVLAAVFVRNPFLNRPLYYFLCYSAMIVYDAFTASWGWMSIVINFSNMVFIITVAKLLLRYSSQQSENNWAINAFNIFHFSLIGALLCSLVGAVGSIDNINDYAKLIPLYADWVSEQFSTGVLMLPCLLSAKWPDWERLPPFRLSRLYPLLGIVISLFASVIIGGAGSLAFPLPALIWCAIRYPLAITALVTLLTGATEIILVASSVINIHADHTLLVGQMFSARLGIATIAICPLIVSVSVDAINQLIKQTALRADFDYLTGVYSRSGLFEKLKKEGRLLGGKDRPFLCVMLLDIDFFKRINDNYGHECGDIVLTSFALKLRQTVGQKELVARMGGEEFVVVVSVGDEAQGYELAEMVRKSIELNSFRYQQESLFITVSVGLATAKLTHRPVVDIFNELIHEADRNLYTSKRNGRNQTSATAADTAEMASSFQSVP
ncbi:diguanylate cyclase [Enterobacteriaceae bacterium H11S18]|uniref:GGDEF domain-containing protein n=1 Tax=Dryocola clanedunensis TaxID=2925396 RepID=UPI0022F098AA|nr:sensor domain-containing diguanylate cyclase [Dryocola clanedunensis]MCT4713347.1 diguanylate cyclase [Dryocola clanedunensis]